MAVGDADYDQMNERVRAEVQSALQDAQDACEQHAGAEANPAMHEERVANAAVKGIATTCCLLD